MTRFYREYDSDGHGVDGLYANDGDIDAPLLGIAQKRAAFIDKCWCGNLKHTDRPLCNLCIRVSEVDNG